MILTRVLARISSAFCWWPLGGSETSSISSAFSDAPELKLEKSIIDYWPPMQTRHSKPCVEVYRRQILASRGQSFFGVTHSERRIWDAEGASGGARPLWGPRPLLAPTLAYTHSGQSILITRLRSIKWRYFQWP